MTLFEPFTGGSPVGYASDPGDVEAGAVECLRLWRGGPASRDRVRDGFADTLGAGAGADAAYCLEQICGLCARHGRLPMAGAPRAPWHDDFDEACFARFIATASEGAREDALLIATLIVRPDVAPVVVELAQELGLALKRLGLRRRRII